MVAKIAKLEVAKQPLVSPIIDSHAVLNDGLFVLCVIEYILIRRYNDRRIRIEWRTMTIRKGLRVDRAARAKQSQIAKELCEIGLALPGSVEVRRTRCGKPNCRCKAEPAQLHGPYIVWTRKVDGKTVTRVLTPEQLDDYRPLFDNARRLRELVVALQNLTLQVLETDDRWRTH